MERKPMDAKTSGMARDDIGAGCATASCDGGAGLLSALSSVAYYRAAAAQAKALEAMTTAPGLKQHLREMIARYERRAVEIEGSAKA
jgi:hypothetical protein